MADQRLTEDRLSAETLKDSLVMLRDNKGYRLLVQSMQDRLQRDQRLLEAGQDPLQMYRLQGKTAAYRDCLALLDELISKVNHEHSQHVTRERENDRSGSHATLPSA